MIFSHASPFKTEVHEECYVVICLLCSKRGMGGVTHFYDVVIETHMYLCSCKFSIEYGILSAWILIEISGEEKALPAWWIEKWQLSQLPLEGAQAHLFMRSQSHWIICEALLRPSTLLSQASKFDASHLFFGITSCTSETDLRFKLDHHVLGLYIG